MGFRNILVEGPDCSGKSKVVERLKNTLKWDSKSLHHKEGNQFLRYLKEYANAEQIVFDRGHISEGVYSCLWRGGVPFSIGEKKILDDLIKNGFLLIFACPSIEVLKKRYLERSFKQQIKIEELEKSRKLFIENLADFSPIIYFSDNLQELDSLIELIRGKLK